MKKAALLTAVFLAAVLLLASCGSKDESPDQSSGASAIEGVWNVTGGVDSEGYRKDDVSGLLGEHKVVLTIRKDSFTMNVEDSYTKDYHCQYQDGIIAFIDNDPYVQFSGTGREVAMNVSIDGSRMTWTMPGSPVTIWFSRVP